MMMIIISMGLYPKRRKSSEDGLWKFKAYAKSQSQSQSQDQSKVKESKECPKTFELYVVYYVLAYECLHDMIMPIHVYLCSHCINIACQERMIKRNPLQLKCIFELIKIEPYACSPFIKKTKVVENDNNGT